MTGFRRRRRPSCATSIQSLEPRQLLSAVTGTVFFDSDQNGLLEGREAGAEGVTVFVDQNDNQVLDNGELSTVTNSDGDYEFDLAPGQYVIRQLIPEAMRQTSPGKLIGSAYSEDAPRQTRLFELNTTTGHVDFFPALHTNRQHEIVVLNDGTILGINAANDTLYSIDPQTGAERQIGIASEDILYAMAYDPLGDTVYVLTESNRMIQLATIDRGHALVKPIGTGIRRSNRSISAMTFDIPNRRLIFFDNNGSSFYESQLDGTIRELANNERGLDSWAFELAGDRFLMMDNTGSATRVMSVDPDNAIQRSAFNTDTRLPAEAFAYSTAPHIAHSIEVTSDQDSGDIDFGLLPITAGIQITPAVTNLQLLEGQTAELQVVLESQPLSDVVLDIASSNEDEVRTIDELIFTPQNWFVPKTLYLTGAPDSLLDGDQTSQVTVKVNQEQSSTEYLQLAETISVVTKDIDGAEGITINKSGAPIELSEGDSDTVSFVLDSQPNADVRIDLSTSDSVTNFSTNSLLFTQQNWNTPQVVTVTGVEDDFAYGLRIDIIEGLTTSNDEVFNDLTFNFAVHVFDNDIATLQITKQTVEVYENGTGDSIALSLGAKPARDVVVDLSNFDDRQLQLSTQALTFTTDDWNVPQTVDIVAIDDAFDDGNYQTSLTFEVNDAVSDTSFEGIHTVATVQAFDNDVAGFVLTETNGSTIVSDTGEFTDTMSLVLTSRPQAGFVHIEVTSSKRQEVRPTQERFLFSDADWNIPQTIQLYGLKDFAADGDTTADIRVGVVVHVSDSAFADVQRQTVNIVVADEDNSHYWTTPAVTVQESQAGTFAIRLLRAPANRATFKITNPSPDRISLNTNEVTFTAANWQQTQFVSFTANDDTVASGPHQVLVQVELDASLSDSELVGIPPSIVVITTTEDDFGFRIAPSPNNHIVTEIGDRGVVTIALTSQPTADVTVVVTSSDTGEISIANERLTFTSTNWQQPQGVELIGVPDLTQDRDQVVAVSVSIESTTDPNFSAVPPASVSVTNIDVNQIALDPDADGESRPLTDGLLIVRRMATFSGDALASAVVNELGHRTQASAIGSFIDAVAPQVLDIDGDSITAPLLDGILILRYLAGFRGQALVQGAVNNNGTRTQAFEIVRYLDQLNGTASGPIPPVRPAASAPTARSNGRTAELDREQNRRFSTASAASPIDPLPDVPTSTAAVNRIRQTSKPGSPTSGIDLAENYWKSVTNFDWQNLGSDLRRSIDSAMQ